MPHLVIVEYDPWRMVIGSDSPVFVLYDDRTTIVLTPDGYQSARLEEAEFADLVGDLNVSGALRELGGDYDLSVATDQVTTLLQAFPGGESKRLRVYGSMRKKEMREKAPASLLALFDAAIGYQLPNAQPWLPDKIEVMIWPYEYAPDPSIVWPTEWPDINDASTRQRGDAYSIYLPSDQFEKLREFLKSRESRGAVEINGKKWAVSTRLPFPMEELWMLSSSWSD